MLEPPGRTAMVATAQLPTPRQEETWKDDKSYTTEIGQLLNIRELRSPTFTALRTGVGGGVEVGWFHGNARSSLCATGGHARLPLAQMASCVYAVLPASTSRFLNGPLLGSGLRPPGSGIPILE